MEARLQDSERLDKDALIGVTKKVTTAVYFHSFCYVKDGSSCGHDKNKVKPLDGHGLVPQA